MSQSPSRHDALSDRPVILIGAGDHAKVLIDVLNLLGRRILFATDHNVEVHGKRVAGVLVRGSDECVLDHEPHTVVLVNGVGSVDRPDARFRVYERFTARGYHFDRLIHPTATVADSVELGEGVQLMAGVVIQPGVQVGKNSLVNTQASVDHDCVIGSHVHIAPGAALSGGVHVHDTAHIGTGAVIIQRLDIGAGAVVGAGGVVVKNVPPGATVVGVPAKEMIRVGRTAAHQPILGRVMISASGRRVVLMRHFEQAIAELNLDARVIATDINRLSSAYHLAAEHRVVPRYADPDCREQLLSLCRDERVRLIVPTIDPDLDFYTRYRANFQAIGASVHLSDPQTVKIGNDKKATQDWLKQQGLPTVEQAGLAAVLDGEAGNWQYPLFVKPRFGSSSIGAQRVDHPEQLCLLPREADYIVQTIAPGREYTVDVYVDQQGKCRCAVPRLRLETRGGEVSKGMTCRLKPVSDLARRIAEALPAARGVLNIQIFYDHKNDAIAAIEVNPRFGGGYPLTHQAGAPMTRWVLEELFDLPCGANDEQWRDGVVMLRYDEAVFVNRAAAGVNAFGEPTNGQDKG